MSAKEIMDLAAFLAERDRLWREYANEMLAAGNAHYSPFADNESDAALDARLAAARAALEAHGAQVDTP